MAKESIFTGLNNPKNLSITTVRFDEYFGFTDDEVKEMLKYYDLEEKYHAMKEWYDGYHFGNVDVYCPWDVISYCDELTYNQLYDSIEHIWSVLFATGYLTQRGKPDRNRMQLAIPNMEIRNIFTSQIMNMFRKEAGRDGELLSAFCDALQTGNGEEVERIFTCYLGKTISIRDTFVKKPMKENFYHGILLGILGLSLKSNMPGIPDLKLLVGKYWHRLRKKNMIQN